MNLKKLGNQFQNKLIANRKKSLLMLRYFLTVAHHVITNGGQVSFEWPRFCDGWKIPTLINFASKYGLKEVNFDGCALGLVSSKGNPIKKPWKIISTSPKIIKNFSALTCDGSHTHDACQGSDTLKSGFYNEYMSKLIVDGLIHPFLILIPSKIQISI